MHGPVYSFQQWRRDHPMSDELQVCMLYVDPSVLELHQHTHRKQSLHPSCTEQMDYPRYDHAHFQIQRRHGVPHGRPLCNQSLLWKCNPWRQWIQAFYQSLMWDQSSVAQRSCFRVNSSMLNNRQLDQLGALCDKHMVWTVASADRGTFSLFRLWSVFFFVRIFLLVFFFWNTMYPLQSKERIRFLRCPMWGVSTGWLSSSNPLDFGHACPELTQMSSVEFLSSFGIVEDIVPHGIRKFVSNHITILCDIIE